MGSRKGIAAALIGASSVGALLFACGGGGATSGDTTDAAPPPAKDAASYVDSSLPSDASPDASVDAHDAGAAVTLLVTNDFGPEPGVLVIFHDANGAVLGTATTGTDGTVSQMLSANSQVTAVFQGPNKTQLVTIQGVEPGDALTAFDALNVGFTKSRVELDSLPEGGFPAGSINPYYAMTIGQDGILVSSLPSSINVAYPCEHVGKAPILVTKNRDGLTEIGYVPVPPVSLPTDGSTFKLSVNAPWITDETKVTLVADHVAKDPPNDVQLVYMELSNGVPFPSKHTFTGWDEGDGGLVATFVGHPSFYDAIQTEVAKLDVRATPASYQSYQAIATRAAPPHGDTAVTIDALQNLPVLNEVHADSADAGAPNRPVFTWSAALPLGSIDGIVVEASFEVASDAGVAQSPLVWTILANGTATRVTPPALPAALGNLTLSGSASFSPAVFAIDASFLSGYAEMRRSFAAVAPRISVDKISEAPMLPVEGTLRLTYVSGLKP